MFQIFLFLFFPTILVRISSLPLSQDYHHLPISDKRILQKEYFLQQMMSSIASQPAGLVRRMNRTELAEILLHQQSKRHKRSNTRICSSSSSSSSSTDTEHCCMDSVEIDLHDLGWNFVVAPRILEYKFCRGSCNPEFVGPSFLTNETRSKALFILVAKSALHFPRGLRWVHLAGRAPSDNSP